MRRGDAWTCARWATFLWLLVAVAVAGTPAAGAESRTVLLRFAGPSAVRQYEGLALISVFDRASRQYRLTLVDRTGRASSLPVAPQRTRFDADIGPDARGRPVVVWSQCPHDQRSRCDLRLLRIGSSQTQPIRGANTSASEMRPTVWRGRLVFERRDRRGVSRVLMRSLSWPSTHRSRGLPGAPRRKRCLSGRGHCRARAGQVRELELRGQTLGLIVNYVVDDPDAVGDGVDEVRVHNLSTTTTHSIATVEPGEGGQIYAGLSLTNDHLGFVRVCEGDRGGCIGRSRIYRHHLRSRRSQIAPGRYRALTGMALLNNGNSLQIDPDPGDVAELGLTSSLILAGPISWRAYHGPF